MAARPVLAMMEPRGEVTMLWFAGAIAAAWLIAALAMYVLTARIASRRVAVPSHAGARAGGLVVTRVPRTRPRAGRRAPMSATGRGTRPA